MKTMFILCGPIGCGKSTLARKAAKTYNAIITNDDAIVTMVHGDYNLYDKALKPLYKGIEQNIITHAICLGRDVIVDRTNYSRAMRARYFSLAKSFDCKSVLVSWEWPEPIVSAKRRFNSDSRGYCFEQWLEVANTHFALYEPPTIDEGFDDEWLQYQDEVS